MRALDVCPMGRFPLHTALVNGPPVRNHFFSDKKVAVSYARSWGEANRPAKVRLATREGRIEAEWVYEPFARRR